MKLDDLVPYDALVIVTHRLAGRLGLTVHVRPLGPILSVANYGWTDCRYHIRYAKRAPLSTVPHELAHIMSGSADHGEAWRAALLSAVEAMIAV